jgi:hypothetical protein
VLSVVANTVRFSPDAKWLACASGDGTVYLYSFSCVLSETPLSERWDEQLRLEGHKDDVFDISWSPDSRWLATAGVDNTVRVFEIPDSLDSRRRTAKTVHEYHKSIVKGVAWDPLNEYLCSIGSDHHVLVLRIADSEVRDMVHPALLSKKKSIDNSVFARLSWSPVGDHLVIPHLNLNHKSTLVAVFREDIAELFRMFPSHEAQVHSFEVSEATIPAAAFRCTVDAPIVCARHCPALFRRRPEFGGSIAGYVWFVTGSSDGSLSLWNALQPKSFMKMSGVSREEPRDFAWSPDGKHLIAVSTSILCCQLSEKVLGTEAAKSEIDTILSSTYGERVGKTVDSNTIIPPNAQSLTVATMSTEKARDVAMPDSTHLLARVQPSAPDSSASAQTITISKTGKKRIAPVLVSSAAVNAQAPPSIPDLQQSVSSVVTAKHSARELATVLRQAAPVANGRLGSVESMDVSEIRAPTITHEGGDVSLTAPSAKRPRTSNLMSASSVVTVDGTATAVTVHAATRDGLNEVIVSCVAGNVELWRDVVAGKTVLVHACETASHVARALLVTTDGNMCSVFGWDLVSGFRITAPLLVDGTLRTARVCKRLQDGYPMLALVVEWQLIHYLYVFALFDFQRLSKVCLPPGPSSSRREFSFVTVTANGGIMVGYRPGESYYFTNLSLAWHILCDQKSWPLMPPFLRNTLLLKDLSTSVDSGVPASTDDISRNTFVSMSRLESLMGAVADLDIGKETFCEFARFYAKFLADRGAVVLCARKFMHILQSLSSDTPSPPFSYLSQEDRASLRLELHNRHQNTPGIHDRLVAASSLMMAD